MAETKDVKVSFAVKGMTDTLHVLSFHGEEELSNLFQFSLVLGCASADVDFKKLIGQEGLLTLKNKWGTRHFHGIISRFVQKEKTRHVTVYYASLVPKAWRLLHTSDCRVFQKMHIKKLISEELLKKLKIDHKFRTKGGKDPVKRTYCVQYRESTWHFISRLLEEEGFFYFFEHSQGKHVLQIGNDNQFFEDIAGKGKSTTLEYHSPADAAPDSWHIYKLQYSQDIRPGQVVLNDYNPDKPALDQKAPKKAKKDTELEVYDYPGAFGLPEAGKDLAQVRLQEARAMRKVAEGESDCHAFCPGFTFNLDKSERSTLNKKRFVLTRVEHIGETHEDMESGAINDRIRYHNEFCGIVRDRAYRPPRVTPKPVVRGCQTAVVVGPSGEEIYTKKGMVKVQFHWDRRGKKDENSSCWVRVAQTVAGQGWGALVIPRIGQEVVVDFLEGDPDRPIILGCVYHAQNLPPYTDANDKTKTTLKTNSSLGGGGFNELCMDDKKGKEQVFMHAQRDMKIVVKRNQTATIGANQTITVQKARTITIKDEDDKLTVKKGNREVVVDEGCYSIECGNHIIMNATNSASMSSKGIEVTGHKTATYDSPTTKIKATKSATIESAKITLKAGASKIEMTATGIKINGPVVKINC